MTLTRSLLTILVPGLVAVAPWVLLLVQYTSATFGYGQYTSLGNALLFAIAVVAGTACEGLGSHIEHRWDKQLEGEFQVTANWYDYLARKFAGAQPVGYDYLSRMVTTLYFELAMLIAVVPFAVGGAILTGRRFPQFSALQIPLALIATGIGVAYFRWQARCTHQVLCKTRKELNARLSVA